LQVVGRAAAALGSVFAVQELGIASVDYSQSQSLIGVPIALAGVAFGPLIDRFGVKPLYLLAIVGGDAVCFALARQHGRGGPSSTTS
jgi:MFS family permease